MEGSINGGRCVNHAEGGWRSIKRQSPALLPRFFGGHNDKSTVLTRRPGKKGQENRPDLTLGGRFCGYWAIEEGEFSSIR
jgi:hypothetical protein